MTFDLRCNCCRTLWLTFSTTRFKAFAFSALCMQVPACNKFSSISASSYFQDGTKVFGRCGGFCGKCIPHMTTGLPIQVIWTFRSRQCVPKRRQSLEPANSWCLFLCSSVPEISRSKMSVPFFQGAHQGIISLLTFSRLSK